MFCNPKFLAVPFLNLTSPPTDDTAAEKVKQSHERFKKGTAKNFGLQNKKIINAAKTATNFIDYIDGVGLIVGDMRGNTLKQNTLLDAYGMAVRKGNSEIVRFGTAPIVITNTDGDKNWMWWLSTNIPVPIDSYKSLYVEPSLTVNESPVVSLVLS